MRELSLSEIAHLDAQYGNELAEDTPVGLELPYRSLGGPGFERLCYHLLVSDGKTPRFYGRPGQGQYGIDLIVSDGAECDVYQCKNVAGFDSRALKAALDLFHRNWKSRDLGFPRPKSFTICITEDIRERTTWDAVTTDFSNETGIPVIQWDKTFLDGRLRRSHDIVADLFGDVVADRFCEHSKWNDGRWARLLRGQDPTIDRFLRLEEKRGLVLPEDYVRTFDDIRTRGNIILVEGGSGVGKSFTALALAKATRQRIMYTSVDPDDTASDLADGITARVARDTVFVLDNCHRNWSVVATATKRVGNAMGRRSYTLIQIGQTSPDKAEMVSTGAVDHVRELRDLKSSIRIKPDFGQFCNVLRAALPAGRHVTDSQSKIMYDLTAGNLATLDLVLQSGIEPDQSGTVIDAIADKLATTWFGSAYPFAPALQAFASIAQFDVMIPAGVSWPQDELKAYQKAIDRFVLRQGAVGWHPGPSWRFTHAREAELVSRVLSAVSGQNWLLETGRHISDHLLGLARRGAAFQEDLRQILRGRLAISEDAALKVNILLDHNIRDLIENNIDNNILDILSSATFILHQAKAASEFVPLLAKKIRLVLEAPQTQQAGWIDAIGAAIRTLGTVDPSLLVSIQSSVGVDRVLETTRANGTLFDLFKILAGTTPGFSAELIAAVDVSIVNELVDNTIAAERSIGTLGLAISELGNRRLPDGRSQLEALEPLLYGAPMLRLIRANGTLCELFKILESSTSDFSAGLIAALDEAIARELIDKTIAVGRSIGTLDLALRALKSRLLPDGRSHLEALEPVLGGAPMLRLIRANGTLFELLMILKSSTPDFSAGLIAALDEAIARELIDKTIAVGRSVGTLSLALRALRSRLLPDGRSQLEALETVLGGAPMLRLIRANGTLFELSMLLKSCTPGFSEDLIAALDVSIVNELIDNTIAAEQSVATISFALRELGKRLLPDGRSQLEALETVLGGAPMLRLIRANGTLFDLFKILEYSTSGFSAGLVAVLDEDIVGELIDKTIAAKRSVGTLHFTLRKLATRLWPDGHDQRWALERLFSVSQFWRLVGANGDLNDLAYLLEDASQQRRRELFEPDAAPDVSLWRCLLGNGSFFSLARFHADALHQLPAATIDAFNTAMAFEAGPLAHRSSWYELSTGHARLSQSKGLAVPEVLEAALAGRAADCSLTSLHGLDFQEACAAMQILWDYAPERHQELADRIWDVLPEAAEWPSDYQLLNSGSVLFPILSDRAFSPANAQRVVKTFWPTLPPRAVETASGALLATFLWRLQGFLEARQGQPDFPQPRTLSEDMKSALLLRLDILAKTTKSNADKLGILSFAGAIAYYWPGLRPDVGAAVRGKVLGFRYLVDQALSLAFVPAALATIGLSFLDPARVAFEPERIRKLRLSLKGIDAANDRVRELESFLLRQQPPR